MDARSDFGTTWTSPMPIWNGPPANSGANGGAGAGASREARREAETACHSCRRRKVRCDRTFPRCTVCVQRDQTCNYPPGLLKPGPKLGTVHRRRRRPRAQSDQSERQRTNNEEHSPSQSPSRDHFEDTEVRSNLPSLGNGRGQIASNPENGVTAPAAAESTAPEGWSPSRERPMNIQDLSFILHPSHESPPIDQYPCSVSNSGILDQEPILIAGACVALGVDQATLTSSLKVFFDNMVAMTLFHEPSFREKINNIASTSQVHALLAAILAFATRFYLDQADAGDPPPVLRERSAHFLDLAFSHIDEALKECDDEAPPLCVLQALIVATHCQLTRGVRGKAWRSLGTCIRLAYELNFHLIDADHSHDMETMDPQQWCDREEKRRAWWAIWEMDVFASTIRRTPPAVDWSQMETFLPVEDQDWFQKTRRPSCFMDRNPISRWKLLQESGNQSPKAWFLIVNSLMKEAQIISSPRSIPHRSPCGEAQDSHGLADHRNRKVKDPPHEASKRLELLANSAHCFNLALPAHLRYRKQYLAFGERTPGQMVSQRQLHCGIYNIYVMSQLAKLMIYRHDVFAGRTTSAPRTHDHNSDPVAEGSAAFRPSQALNMPDEDNLALQRYFEATDNILTIITRSADDHIRHINPFLSSTIWLASAVQLIRMQFCGEEVSRNLIKSKFEILYFTYKGCISFWDTHTALQQNLEMLKAQLETAESSVQNSEKQGSCTMSRPISHDTRRKSRIGDGSSFQQVNNGRIGTNATTTEIGSDQPINHNFNNAENSLRVSPNVAPFQTPPSSSNGSRMSETQAQASRQQHPQASSSFSNAFQRTLRSDALSQAHPRTLRYPQVQQNINQQLSPSEPNLSTQYNSNPTVCSPGNAHFEPLSTTGQLALQGREFLSGTDTFNDATDLGYDWQNISLPGHIHDVLSGFLWQ